MNDPEPMTDAQQYPPANIWLRMVAFAMDMALVFTLLMAVHSILPEAAREFIQDLQEEKASFNDVFTHSQSFVKEHPDAATHLMLVSLLSMVAPFLYFFLSEIFLGGCTLGKKCFNLRTAYKDSPRLPPLGAHAARSFLKGIASLALVSQNPLSFLFIFNFIIAFYNKGRKAGHDLLARTSVVPGFLPEEQKPS